MKPEKTIEKLSSGKDVVITALGDSLTYGWMVRKGYLDFLKEMLLEYYPASSITILNRGIPGDTAQGGLERLRSDVLDDDPHCVLVQFALNDAFIGYNPRVFQNNIRGIISGIQENSDADIVLITSVYLHNSPENDMAEQFYSTLEDLSTELSLPIARVHEKWKEAVRSGVMFSRLVQYDGVHPTVEGYKLMAEAVMEVFQ